MSYTIGVIVFAVGLLASVCLHEAGHMVTARAFGMRVTRYFVGFGPTVWSFRRGEVEYGLKAIPAGGFVSIVGMVPNSPEPEAEQTEREGRAFWQGSLLQRSIVLAAGSATHLILAVVLLVVALAGFGVSTPKPLDQTPTVVGTVAPCVVPGWDLTASGRLRDCSPTDPRSPAATIGLRAGDRIVSLNGTPHPSYRDFQGAIRSAPTDAPVAISYVRDGRTIDTTVTLAATQRPALDDTEAGADAATSPTPTIGISNAPQTQVQRLGPIEAVGTAVSITGQTIVLGAQAIVALPAKVGSLISAITGGQRNIDDPVSVVGASRLGGEVIETRGLNGAADLLSILASLNIFLGIFNLVPLPPLDGGHLAINWYEAARRRLARGRNRPDPGPVDRERLIPLTLTVILVFGAFALLTVWADIVNPIRLS